MRTHEPPMAQPEVYDELSEASDDEIQYRRRRDDESSSGRTVSQPPVSGAPCENDNAKDLTPDDILQQDLQNTINGAAPTPGAWPTPEATPDQTPEPAESRISQIPSTSGPSSLESSSEIHGSVHSKLKTKRQPRSMAGIDPSNITEGKRQPKPRKDNDDYISTQFASFMAGTFENPSLHRSQLPPPPRHYGEARKHPFWPNWKRAMDEELGELDQRGVFRKIRRPRNAHIIPLKWVFTYKFDDSGHLTKFKARLCVRGDQQPFNSLDTRSATLALRSFRAIMALAAYFDLDIDQSDVTNAFVNSKLDELVYCELPPGYKESGFCLILLMALYGLRRSPLLWFKDLGAQLRRLGLMPVGDETCIYSNGRVIVLFYVDDILWISHYR